MAFRCSSGSRSQVLPVKLEEVEGAQHHGRVDAGAAAEEVKQRQPVGSADDYLAIDQAGAAAEHAQRQVDRRVVIGPVVAVAGDYAIAAAVAPGQEPEAVELDLLNAVASAAGAAVGRQGTMKPGRERPDARKDGTTLAT